MEDANNQLQVYGRLLAYPVTYFGKSQAGTIGGYAPSEPKFVRSITTLTRLGYDCFCNINPTRPVARKAARQHVTAFSRILLDFDVLAGRAQLVWDGVRGDIAELLTGGGLVEMAAVSVISTGRGIHCYIHCTPLRLESDLQRLQVEHATSHFLRGIAAALPDSMGARLDSTTSDLARVARCPGTINTKCGRMARIIQVASSEMPPSFTHWLLEQAPSRPVPQPKVGADTSNLWRVLPHLTDTAQRFLCEGAPEGRRHHDAFATARSLREHGVPHGLALEWVSLGGSHCRKPLLEEECRGPVASAYR